MALHRGELRADFRRFYMLDLDRMGEDFGALYAADLAAHLPRESALKLAVDPDCAWGEQEIILAQIEYDIRCMSCDGKGAKPSPMKTPSQRRPRAAKPADAREMARVADALGIPEDRR